MGALLKIISEVSAYDRIIQAVMAAVPNLETQRHYITAIREFEMWRNGDQINRESVGRWRSKLMADGLSPSTVNQKLAAIKLLAREAAQYGAIDEERNSGIQNVEGAKQRGDRTGNWLTKEQAQKLVSSTSDTLSGYRDRAAIALLVGCGLRRGEVASLTFEHIQQREGRWVIVDLRGKHGRVRSVPMPAWVKAAVDVWSAAAAISTGRVIRRVRKNDKLGVSLTPQAIYNIVSEAGNRIGQDLGAHDLRRTCAKLSRSSGGELEQIQMLLGHASINTTERYLGTQQDLSDAPNDKWKLKI
jgi:integrase